MKHLLPAAWGTFAAATFLIPTAAHAQAPINVTVDGDLVRFTNQPPVLQFGSVLVPLRGVFEKLGATVAYDGGTKSILAVRGATTVSLRLGSREAVINNVPQNLSVPAQAVNGTTLVPLRFVSEALGAQVKWVSSSRTVIVNSTPDGTDNGNVVNNGNNNNNSNNNGGNNNNNNFNGTVDVASLTYSSNGGNGALKGGDTLKVSLRGTPGGKAAFSLPGIESAKSVPMREVSSGQYEGTFTIPNNLSIKGATLLASLNVGSSSSPLIQGGDPITVDSVGPKFDSLSPAPNASVSTGKTLIYGTFSDTGTGIAPGSVRILVDNNDVTSSATVTESFFSYSPSPDLKAGQNSVVVVARDAAGNESRKAWNFTVVPGVNPIKSLTVEPKGQTLEPGDVLTVQMTATPGGKAVYNLGDVAKSRTMNENAPGVYTGTYTLRKGDNLAGVPISAVYTGADGRQTTQAIEQTVQVVSGTPDKPTITNPKPGDTEGGSVTIKGTATPGATVRYSVRYDGQLLIVPASGAISDGEVKADANGNWVTSPVSLTTPQLLSNVSYTVTAVTVGSTPTQVSDAVEVKFKK